jgi:hypothetical protein
VEELGLTPEEQGHLVALPVHFAQTPLLQPREHVPSLTWGDAPGCLAGDGKTPRAVLGQQKAFARAQREPVFEELVAQARDELEESRKKLEPDE